MNKLKKISSQKQVTNFSKKVINEVKVAKISKSDLTDKQALELSKIAYRNDSGYAHKINIGSGHEIFKIMIGVCPANIHVGIDYMACDKWIATNHK